MYPASDSPYPPGYVPTDGGPPRYPQGPPGGYPQGYAPYGSRNREYAGFGSRLGAYIIDGLVSLLILLPFAAVAIWGVVAATADCDWDEVSDGQWELYCPPGASIKGGPLAIAIAAGVVGLVLMIWLMSRWAGRGQTPGMKATHISLLDKESGQPIGTARAFGRHLFAWLISANICYLGYLWMLWDKDKQTWHDKVVGSVVVRN